MAQSNNHLNFYIIHEEEDCYSLYNLHTDKRILKYVEEKEVNSFLRNNSPNHPYLEKVSQSYTVSIPNGTYDPAQNYYIQSSLSASDSLEDNNYDFSIPDFLMTGEDYNNSNENNKEKKSPVQLELNLVYSKGKDNKEENNIDTSELPYLGDNED